MSKVYVLRGIPGSGKSTWAKQFPDTYVVSTDHYMVDEKGQYRFDPARLGYCHNRCLERYILHLHRLKLGEVLIVDNTNLQLFEIVPYYRLAEVYGFEVEVVQFLIDPALAAQRNTHGVPEPKILAMVKGIEPLPAWWKVQYITVTS